MSSAAPIQSEARMLSCTNFWAYIRLNSISSAANATRAAALNAKEFGLRARQAIASLGQLIARKLLTYSDTQAL